MLPQHYDAAHSVRLADADASRSRADEVSVISRGSPRVNIAFLVELCPADLLVS